jgi:hypothetical protein
MNRSVTHTLSIVASAPPITPRGARIGDLIARLWLALGSPARPASAARRTRLEEASEVRDLARRVEAGDPRFAADLFAAADRHERLPEAPRR